uniref:Uncharacterized protein n=1 Tax=viral metagenome TaxID=1070528 RepID=A0A6M3K110_9ZZZZ
MMKKLIAAVLLVLVLAGIAWASWVDTACVQRCMDAGGLYNRCVRLCTND